MIKWSFPSRADGDTEGFSNPALEWFKGNPLCALAREICQNSLDAQYDENEPVHIVFNKSFVKVDNFPGMDELKDILEKCEAFWPKKGNEKAYAFIDKAERDYNSGSTCVLRISDFNTRGLEGAYDGDSMSSWSGLVKGSAFSAKSSNTAAGSYGIGKSAPFINSKYQTVFYRTLNVNGEKAAQGVAHLMAFKDESYGDKDPVRRSIGYYGNPVNRSPVEKMEELDRISKRTEPGTDLFIPGFMFNIDGNNDWVAQMIGEILENFLMAIEYNNLSITIDSTDINRDSLRFLVGRYSKYAKNAVSFNKILQCSDDNVIEDTLQFPGKGQARLRLMYAGDLNRKILVVRKSGMKITEIKNLPRGISYTGILELEGDKLNEFFRDMENPTHDKWEPKRHPRPDEAKRLKNELEEWVRDTIRSEIEDMSGAESLVDTGNMFSVSDESEGDIPNPDIPKTEKVIDDTKSVDVVMGKQRTAKTNQFGGSGEDYSGGMGTVKGTVDNKGPLTGHRNSNGTRPQNATGRRGSAGGSREDTMYTGMMRVPVRARVINIGPGENKLIFSALGGMNNGEISIVATGENGKSTPLHIDSIIDGTHDANLSSGKIHIKNVRACDKVVVSFRVHGNRNYAMGVEVNGN